VTDCPISSSTTRKIVHIGDERKILNLVTLKEEKPLLTGYLLYKDFKIYSSNTFDYDRIRVAKSELEGRISETVFTEAITGERLERTIILPPPASGKSNRDLFIENCQGDFALMSSSSHPAKDGKEGKNLTYRFLLVDFFFSTCQVIDEKYPQNSKFTNRPCSSVINTSFYDFHFGKKVAEILDPIFPRDLIKLLQLF
jgi:hypothetical protein